MALAVASLILAAACGGSSDPAEPGAADDPTSPAEPADSGVADDSGTETPPDPADDPVPADDPLADAPILEPATTFALENPDDISSVAMSPDGSTIAIARQAALGEIATITLYDAATGDAGASTEVDVVRLGGLKWMADNRIVAAATNDADPTWRSFDDTTLEALLTVPLDFDCGEGQPDRKAGAIYQSSDGLGGTGEDICRVDTTDGSVIRSGAGVLVEPQDFWVLAESGEVAVLHRPGSNGEIEVVYLDGASLTANSSTTIDLVDEFVVSVVAVGASIWINDNQVSRLEPGSIPATFVDSRSAASVSPAGSVFLRSSTSDVLVLVSAVDGSVIGTMPTGFYADWSLDDSTFARLTFDGQIEVYRF